SGCQGGDLPGSRRDLGKAFVITKLKLPVLAAYFFCEFEWAAGQNKQHFITKNTAKLDRETEELHHDRVSLEVGKVIQQGRQSKGLTQKDLATKINEKPQVIADYESGRAIPNNQVMGKIERAIGLKLRGKDIGKPLETGPKGK
uniref:HTH cro/C1-type domain-containing protein n=1 Tax=Zonotrichia albicollis TaxID=44394 RepID=A0A8D2MXP2_ZONAL